MKFQNRYKTKSTDLTRRLQLKTANFAKLNIKFKLPNVLTKLIKEFLQNFEYGAVQRCAKLVDLEKCFPMSIYLQRSVPIQKRTSPLKFADFAEKSE